MAAIRDYAVTIYAAATAAMVCEIPEHVIGDLLVAFVNKDTATAFTTPSGWTAVQTQVSAGAAGGVYAKRAASASETVTFALASETCMAVLVSCRDVNGTTVADAIPTSAKSGADDSTNPLGGIGLTTGFANSLLLHGISGDSAFAMMHLPPWVNIFGGDTGANGLTVAYSFEPTVSTAVSAPSAWSGAADDTRAFIVEVRDGSSGAVKPAYIPLDTVPSDLVSPLTGVDAADKGAWVAAAGTAITSVAGKSASGTTIATTTDSGYNPFRTSARQAGASSTTALNHTEFNLTTPFDATAKQGLLFGTFLHLAPRDYVDSGTAAQGGKYVIFGSTTNNWRAWVVGGQFSKTDRADARNNYLIEVNASATEYGSAGTPNWASLDYMAFGSAGYYGPPAILWNELWLLDVVTLAGGTATNPFTFDDLVATINNGCGFLPLVQQAGAGGTFWIPVKFGGNENIGIACNLNTFQFPRAADEIDYLDFHVSANKVGFEFHGTGASDKLHFTNCVFTSPSPYYWRFHASHSSDALIDFSGSSVVGATVTLRSTSDLDGVTFIDCPAFTQNGAALSNCAFSNTKVTSASPGDAALITDSTFESPGAGHGIEIGGTAANITLDGVVFTGYAGTNGSTGNEAIYVNIASGSMTISISGGGSTPSIRTAGATVTVQNSVTVSVTAKDANTQAAVQSARVLLYAATGASVTITRSGATATVAHTGHGLATGAKRVILGANQGEYNGIKTITVTNANEYTFSVSGTPTTPATGTITSHLVVLDGDSNAAGIVQDTGFAYTADVAVTGRVRKGTAATRYKTSPVSGTITTAGFSATAFLVSDE